MKRKIPKFWLLLYFFDNSNTQRKTSYKFSFCYIDIIEITYHLIFIIINKLKKTRELRDPSVDADNIILHVIRKILNYIPTTRIVYRQESVMDIARLPLTTSSEQIVPVHAIGYYRIDDTPSKQSLMSLYAHRKTKLKFCRILLRNLQ